MQTSKNLSLRLREVFLNGKWIANTNYKDQLDSTDFHQAVQKVEQLNTVALLTFHISYYLKGLIQVLEGGPLEIRDKYSFDMPEMNSDLEWKNLVQDLYNHAEKFSELVSKLSDEQLELSFVKPEYGTYQRNIEAVLEHSYYHLGQMVLVRKLIQNKV